MDNCYHGYADGYCLHRGCKYYKGDRYEKRPKKKGKENGNEPRNERV